MSDVAAGLRKWALRFEGTDEGIACAGTPAERATVRANKKAFLFVGVKDAMMKVTASLAEAKALEARDPKKYKVGANGWVKVFYDDAHAPDLDTVHRWIDESHAAAAGTAEKKPADKKTSTAQARPKPASASAKRAPRKKA